MLLSRAILLKETIKSALVGFGTTRAVQSLVPPKIIILRYHSARENPAQLDAYIERHHSLYQSFSYSDGICRTDCRPVTMDEIPEFVTGARLIPKRGVAITFDDGFRDNYEIAAPILEEFRLRGAFYIATSSVEGRPLWFVRLRYWMVRADISRPQFLEASRRCAILTEPEREEFMKRLESADSVKSSEKSSHG